MRRLLAGGITWLLLPGVALAGGFEPTSRPALDPAEAAHFVITEEVPEASSRSFAAGGRFGGDLDGDGADDLVLQAGVDGELEIWFGDPEWGSDGQDDDNEVGDTTLRLPQGCRQSDDRVHYAALGDLDGDGFDDLGVGCFEHSTDVEGAPVEGAFGIWFGRAQPWGGSVSDPDVFVLGVPVELDGETPIAGERTGAFIEAAGDLDADGYDDFVVTGDSFVNTDVPLAWVFFGGPDLRSELDSLEDAHHLLAGHVNLRCLDELRASALGDLDGDGLGDIAFGCSTQPPPNPLDPSEDNELDIAWSVYLGGNLASISPGALQFSDRDFRWDAGVQRVPQATPFAALGDIDADGFGDVGLVGWFAAGQSLSGQILAGGPGPFEDVGLTTPYTPFLLGSDFTHPEGVQLAPAGPSPGARAGLWLKSGRGTDATVGLLLDPDPALWAETSEPPVVVIFSTPGGADAVEDWRLGIGGPGDADGDGISDLLILGGFDDDDGCDAAACGGAWLILCGDLDGDGVSACAGDCDDADSGVSPAISEQCDTADHDCDGLDGLADIDGDGFEGCAGDCDDNDPARFPGAEETCDSPVDMNCDGLSPADDTDGDGSANCDDCQPWDPLMAPGADELCDGLDNDCDEVLPADEQDIDRDGWTTCSAGGGETDCDDLDPFVHPFRFEDCANGIDDDCNGSVDEDRDEDADGVRTCDGDCRDTDATVFPGAEELCDGLDNNCNGVIDDARDFDFDGFSECSGDCDNFDDRVHPGAIEVCEPGLDSNCDGLDDLFDDDGDGFTACSGDCDDVDPGIAPVSADYCDRRDNDCDGVPDLPWDLDTDSWATCGGDCADGDSARHPQIAEPDCDDGLDGDCDGIADLQETLDCPPVVEPPPPDPRPYGLTCADCRGSLVDRGAGGSGALVGLLVVLGLARRRRRRGSRLRSRRGLGLWVLGLTGAGLLAAPGPAAAARKEPGLLVYLAPQPDIGAMVEARDLAAAENVAPRETLHTSELLDSASDVLLVEGAQSAAWCAEGADPPALTTSIDAALDALIQLNYAVARDVLDVAVDALPCLENPLPKRQLQNLFYYRGVANTGLRDHISAEADFRNTLAVQLDYPGDPNFPPGVNDALEAERTGMSTATAVSVVVYAPGNTVVRVDGVEHDREAGPVQLLPGTHVAQMRRGRLLWTVVFDIAADSRPILIHADDRVRAFKDCVLDPAAREWTASVMGLAAADVDADIAGLIDLQADTESLRWLYRPSRDVFSFEDGFYERRGGRAQASGGSSKPRGDGGGRSGGGGRTGGGGRSGGGGTSSGGGGTAAASRASLGPTDDRVRLRVSGAFEYVHPFVYVQIPVDLDVRLVAGLFVDVGGSVAIAGPSSYGTVFMPAFSLGASYRIDLGAFQPRLGALARVGLDSGVTDDGSIGVRVGWAGRVGFDVAPDGSPLLLGLDVQAGMLGAPFYLSASFGAGVRF